MRKTDNKTSTDWREFCKRCRELWQYIYVRCLQSSPWNILIQTHVPFLQFPYLHSGVQLAEKKCKSYKRFVMVVKSKEVQFICIILIQTLKETLKGLTGSRKSKRYWNVGTMLAIYACSLCYLEIKDEYLCKRYTFHV